jgi:hypothetical protein
MTQSNAIQHELIRDQGIPAKGDDTLDAIDNLLGETNDDRRSDSTNLDIHSDSDNDSSANRETPEGVNDDDAQDTSAQKENEEDGAQEEEVNIDYNQELEIPMPYGMEKMTLSEMKDKVSNMHMETKRVQEQENALMIQRQEINAIMQTIGEVPPEVHQALKQQHQANLVRENQLMIDAVPDWKDTKVFTQDRITMKSLTDSYGFSEQELNTVTDHRLVKMIRDYSLLKLKLEKADPKQVKKQHKQTASRRKPSKQKRSDNFINEAAASNNQQLKNAAIAQLLE